MKNLARKIKGQASMQHFIYRFVVIISLFFRSLSACFVWCLFLLFFISSFILHIVDYMRYVGIKYVKVVRCIIVKLLSLKSEKQVFFPCKCTNTKRESNPKLFLSISMHVCTIVMRCFIRQVTWSCQII